MEVNVYKNPTSFSCWSVRYGTVIGKVIERGQYALTKENTNSNKENSDAFSYLVKLDDISSAIYTIRGENCYYVWGYEYEIGTL